ncbi:MAG: hypothetical protein VCA35_08925 [Roseibacillus sp.]
MTNKKRISVLALLATALLGSCSKKQEEGEGNSQPPEPPTPEVVAALESQAVGKKLLGNTRILIGGKFVSADLQNAPEFYLVHYSASW